MFLPETATVTEREKTLRCDITGFYPEKLDVTWQIQNGSRMVPAGNTHLTRVCTEMAVLNADGTYSISSGITVHSSAVEGGETHIICQIQHSTFRGPYSKSVRLTVQGGSSFFCSPTVYFKTIFTLNCVYHHYACVIISV